MHPTPLAGSLPSMRLLFALFALPFAWGCVSGRLIPLSRSELAAKSRAEDERAERDRNARAAREFEERASREIEVVDEASRARPYRILGYVSADVDSSDTSAALFALRAKALRLGGNAITDLKHEVVAEQIQSESRGGAFASPLLGGAIATSRGTTTTTVRNVEHWTAKVIAWESASTAAPQSATGTGFFVSPEGLLVTAYHVVAGSEGGDTRLSVWSEGQKWPATLLRVDPANDLALLKVSVDVPVPFLAIRDSAARIGERVYTVGFPNLNIQGLSPKLTDGIVNSDSGARDDPRMMQISAEVQPGNSGGALVDVSGHVVGVVVSRLSDSSTLRDTGALPQNVNYAIKAMYLAPLAPKPLPLPPKAYKSEPYSRAIRASCIVVASTVQDGRSELALSPVAPVTTPVATPSVARVSPASEVVPATEGCIVELLTGEATLKYGVETELVLVTGLTIRGRLLRYEKPYLLIQTESGKLLRINEIQTKTARQ